jgi:hypothetical protein
MRADPFGFGGGGVLQRCALGEPSIGCDLRGSRST